MLRHNLPGGLVTFLFTDIEGSTRLARLLGPAYRQVLIEHRRIVLRALSEHGGIPLFTEGDSIFVVFSDAASGVAACVSAQLALADYTWPSPQARPSVRMGLHSGFAQPVGGEYTSPEVHRAARVAAAAHGGQIMCSEATVLAAGSLNGDAWLLDLGLHRLRGFDDRERLYQVVADRLERKFPHPRTLAASPHNLPSVVTSFIGRGAERSALVDLLDDQPTRERGRSGRCGQDPARPRSGRRPGRRLSRRSLVHRSRFGDRSRARRCRGRGRLGPSARARPRRCRDVA